jgi:hypothetical protein
MVARAHNGRQNRARCDPFDQRGALRSLVLAAPLAPSWLPRLYGELNNQTSSTDPKHTTMSNTGRYVV